MKSATEHAKRTSKRAAEERTASRTIDMRDLTDVMRYNSTPKKKSEKKGAPIGQRWD